MDRREFMTTGVVAGTAVAMGMQSAHSNGQDKLATFLPSFLYKRALFQTQQKSR